MIKKLLIYFMFTKTMVINTSEHELKVIPIPAATCFIAIITIMALCSTITRWRHRPGTSTMVLNKALTIASIMVSLNQRPYCSPFLGHMFMSMFSIINPSTAASNQHDLSIKLPVITKVMIYSLNGKMDNNHASCCVWTLQSCLLWPSSLSFHQLSMKTKILSSTVATIPSRRTPYAVCGSLTKSMS